MANNGSLLTTLFFDNVVSKSIRPSEIELGAWKLIILTATAYGADANDAGARYYDALCQYKD